MTAIVVFGLVLFSGVGMAVGFVAGVLVGASLGMGEGGEAGSRRI
jgi:hypothetical protein